MRDEQRMEIGGWLSEAIDHLKQYRAYSEAMRKIGRGCSIYSAYRPEHLIEALEVLRDELVHTTGKA